MGDFKLEGDLRKWVRNQAQVPVWWIEPAKGSTIGLPDCCTAYGRAGEVVWVELKIGEMSGYRLTYEVRSEQRQRIREMMDRKQHVSLLVGVKGSSVVLTLYPNDETLKGVIDDVRSAYAENVLMFCPEGSGSAMLGAFEIACRMAMGGNSGGSVRGFPQVIFNRIPQTKAK